ncbi:hypothetical protein GJ496_004476 [Pomphorhynchus laevis]|nr:hypothetical protein GJ496_004476 [Pomphorhynchus laevis]
MSRTQHHTTNLRCCNQSLDVSNWEKFLPLVRTSLRSLTCSSTNCTPHERIFTYTNKYRHIDIHIWLRPNTQKRPYKQSVRIIQVSLIEITDRSRLTIDIWRNCTSQKEQSNCSSNAPPIDSHEDSTDIPDHASTKMPNITTCDPGRDSNSGKHNELSKYNNELMSKCQSIENIRFPSKRLRKKLYYLINIKLDKYFKNISM